MNVYRYDYNNESGITISEFEAKTINCDNGEEQKTKLIIQRDGKVHKVVDSSKFDIAVIDPSPYMYSFFSNNKQLFIDQIIKKIQRDMQRKKEETDIYMTNSKVLIGRIKTEAKRNCPIVHRK